MRDEISRAVLRVLEGETKETETLLPSPSLNFLDGEENMGHVVTCFEEEDRAFYQNFLHTQLFSVHSKDLFHSIASSESGKDAEVLGMLKQLILMEEKSREVLHEYARCGVARLSPGLSKALRETESILGVLKDSKKKLEGEVTKKRILTKRNFLGLGFLMGHHGNGEGKKKSQKSQKSFRTSGKTNIITTAHKPAPTNRPSCFPSLTQQKKKYTRSYLIQPFITNKVLEYFVQILLRYISSKQLQ